MKEKKYKIFEYIAFIYFFTGVLCGLILEYTNIKLGILEFLTLFYLYTFLFASLVYLIFGCLLCKHRSFLMNIIDGILCYCLTIFYPYPIFHHIYNFNKYLYYFLGGCFAFLPLIFCVIDKKKIDKYHLLKTITRILMIIFVVVIMLTIKSCNSAIGIE